jgi:hypothetical protein
LKKLLTSGRRGHPTSRIESREEGAMGVLRAEVSFRYLWVLGSTVNSHGSVFEEPINPFIVHSLRNWILVFKPNLESHMSVISNAFRIIKWIYPLKYYIILQLILRMADSHHFGVLALAVFAFKSSRAVYQDRRRLPN